MKGPLYLLALLLTVSACTRADEADTRAATVPTAANTEPADGATDATSRPRIVFLGDSLTAGLGLGLRSTWDIGSELQSGALKVVLPQYRGSSNVAIYAVYPCRDFMPEKVNVFIEFLAELPKTGSGKISKQALRSAPLPRWWPAWPRAN
mgnify:CR=1 FL=1